MTNEQKREVNKIRMRNIRQKKKKENKYNAKVVEWIKTKHPTLLSEYEKDKNETQKELECILKIPLESTWNGIEDDEEIKDDVNGTKEKIGKAENILEDDVNKTVEEKIVVMNEGEKETPIEYIYDSNFDINQMIEIYLKNFDNTPHTAIDVDEIIDEMINNKETEITSFDKQETEISPHDEIMNEMLNIYNTEMMESVDSMIDDNINSVINVNEIVYFFEGPLTQ